MDTTNQNDYDYDDGDFLPTPFSEATKYIEERVLKIMEQGFLDELLVWVPRENGQEFVHVPSLQELSLKILANNADAIDSLDGLFDMVKEMICASVCDSGKMNSHFLEMVLSGVPTVIRLKDCSWLTEEEFTKYFGTLVTSMLEVVQLNKCGRIITECTLLATLAKSQGSLSRLISLSLTGACRLNDKGLHLLVSSAPRLRSINLSRCSLLTYTSLEILADSLGSILKELYIDDCILIDAALSLPALKRLEQLEVLSIAGVPNVCDKFIKDYTIACGHNIKELVLKNCLNLTNESIKAIAKHCLVLHALDIEYMWKLTNLTIQYLADRCRKLRKLKFCGSTFSDEAIAAFLEIIGKSLEELSLNNINQVGHQTTLSLALRAKKLHTLDLSWCQKLTDSDFGLIVDNCLSLRLLKIFGCSQVTNVFIKGHSNSKIQIIGLPLSPLLKHIEGPNPSEGALRYSSV